MKESSPAVTVVMGVYNGEKYLRQAVQSVLSQSFDDFEFIIINDGSTDGTASILAGFSDARMKVITNANNQGLTRCLIRGCSEARGKYIARMDADDISYPRRFEEQVTFLDAHPDHAVVGTQCVYLDSKGNSRGASRFYLSSEEIARDIRRRSPFAHGSTMFLRDAVAACGGYRELFRYAQDYDLWLRVMEKHQAANLPDALYGLRYHRGSLTLRKLSAQSFFVELAREFAGERSQKGTDPLMRQEIDLVRQRIENRQNNGLLERMRIRSGSAVQLLNLMVHRGTLPDILLLWISAAASNPLNRDAWRFLFSVEFKRRMKRALSKPV